MFKHILIPTDGSELSHRAVSKGVQFAQEIGARVTGLTVTEPYHYLGYGAMQMAETAQRYQNDARAHAERNLQQIQEAADTLGVPCDVLINSSDHPYQEIVRTAESQGCDVIFMASHGRHGIGALLMGSETQKVLTHTKIPVLVVH